MKLILFSVIPLLLIKIGFTQSLECISIDALTYRSNSKQNYRSECEFEVEALDEGKSSFIFKNSTGQNICMACTSHSDLKALSVGPTDPKGGTIIIEPIPFPFPPIGPYDPTPGGGSLPDRR